MKIIILSNTKNESGGVERYNFYLRTTLDQMGHSATVFAIEDVKGFHSLLLKCSRLAGLQQPYLGYALGRLALSEKADVYITNGLLGWNMYGKKIINVQHGTFARAADRIDRYHNDIKFFIKRYIWGYFEGVAARRASFVVAVSDETKESVAKYYHAKNIQVIPNCIDTDLFAPKDPAAARAALALPAERKIISFVGRFERAKGNDILEGLFPLLPQMNATMVIAAPNAQNIPTAPHVITREFSQSELSQLYAASDVFLLPSMHEGSSYALLDAMGSGTPFLASPVGLVASFEQQGRFSNCIVHEHSVKAYQMALSKMLNLAPAERDTLTRDLRATILSQHSLQSFFQSYRTLIEKLS